VPGRTELNGKNAMTNDAMYEYLSEIACSARIFIEPVWCEWHRARGLGQPDVASRNTCGRTSFFLVNALQREGLDAEWKTGVPRLSDAGPELGPYGFLVNARWESHSWVECQEWIVDLTADQFGAPPVIVTPSNDVRYRAGTDTAQPIHVANRQRSAEAIWDQWVLHRLTATRLRRANQSTNTSTSNGS
jgi:hypothetical protein